MLSTTVSPSSTVGTRCGGPPQNQRRSPWTRPPLALSRPVASPPRRGLPQSVFDMVDRAACGRSATCDRRSCPRSLSLRGQARHSVVTRMCLWMLPLRALRSCCNQVSIASLSCSSFAELTHVLCDTDASTGPLLAAHSLAVSPATSAAVFHGRYSMWWIAPGVARDLWPWQLPPFPESAGAGMSFGG